MQTGSANSKTLLPAASHASNSATPRDACTSHGASIGQRGDAEAKSPASLIVPEPLYCARGPATTSPLILAALEFEVASLELEALARTIWLDEQHRGTLRTPGWVYTSGGLRRRAPGRLVQPVYCSKQ